MEDHVSIVIKACPMHIIHMTHSGWFDDVWEDCVAHLDGVVVILLSETRLE
jgi:hypothetical protein